MSRPNSASFRAYTLHNYYTIMFKIGFDHGGDNGSRACSGWQTGQMMISREQITTPMPPSVKAEAVSDPTASKHPISARATEVR